MVVRNNKILARKRLGSVNERCETDGFHDWEDVMKPSGSEADGHVDIPGDTRLTVDEHGVPPDDHVGDAPLIEVLGEGREELGGR